MSQEEYITRAEFEAFKKQVERQTGEMKAINVNVASADVLNQLQELRKNQEEIFNALTKSIQDNKNDLKEDMATKEDLKAMEERIIDAIRNISFPGKN